MYYQKIISKIIDWQNLPLKLAEWSSDHKKIVFTNGCFDILHKGHVEYLSKAADLGDVFILGLNSDASVKRLKGLSRPLQDQSSRALVMAALEFISVVVLFEEDTPLELIRLVQPDVLVKGGDYRPEEIAGYDIVKNKGGQIVTIDIVEGYSTTSVVKRMQIV